MAQQPETLPPQGVTDKDFDFLQQIHDRLACDSDNRDAFLDLFADSGKRAITDVHHVLDGAVHLLHGHPQLVAQFYDLVDPVRKGLELVKRAKKALSPAKYNQFVTKLYSIEEEESLDAHQVYRQFKELFGEKHDDLLWGLAEFLPTKYGPPPPRASQAKAEREEHRRRQGRKHTSYAGADAPESSRPSRAKKPRVVDVSPTPASVCFADAGAAGSSKPSRARRPRMYNEYEYYDGSLPERKPASCAVAVADDSKSRRPSRPKKHRMYDEYDGWLPERKPASCAVSVADDSKSSRQSRAKKPRADDRMSMSRHALIGGAVGGSVRVVTAPAPEQAPEVKRFREAWVFETGYSLLAATLKRAGECERLNDASASLNELFLSPEIRGFLAKMYQNKWNDMRHLLEQGGDHAAFALEAILKRLKDKHAKAVGEARRRQDPTRAAQRLLEIAQERVHLEHERVV